MIYLRKLEHALKKNLKASSYGGGVVVNTPEHVIRDEAMQAHSLFWD